MDADGHINSKNAHKNIRSVESDRFYPIRKDADELRRKYLQSIPLCAIKLICAFALYRAQLT